MVSAHCSDAMRKGAQLPIPNETFDFVVYFSLAPDLKRRVAAEMIRVMKRQGLIIWYDYHVNNPSNKDARGIK